MLLKIIRQLFCGTEADLNISPDDRIILVVGPSGSGKSTFVNAAAGANVAKVGHGLKSETRGVQSVVCPSPTPVGGNIILVDTPAYNGTCPDIVRSNLTRWLKRGKDEETRIFGVLYFHKISEKRQNELPRDHLSPFRDLMGNVRRFTLVTTMWTQVEPSAGAAREKQLLNEWNKHVGVEVNMTRYYKPGYDEAWEVINRMLTD